MKSCYDSDLNTNDGGVVMKEKLQEYALLAEIISAIAIIISLIFVGFQIRQSAKETALNTEAIQSSVRQTMLSEDREAIRMVIDYPSLNQRTNLTPEQEVRVTGWLIAIIRMRENYYVQYQKGLLDEVTWFSYRDALIPVLFCSKFGRNVWNQYYWNPDFVKYMNDWVNDTDFEECDVMFVGTNIPSLANGGQ